MAKEGEVAAKVGGEAGAAPLSKETSGLNKLSLVSAFLTIFTFLKDSTEVVEFMLEHVVVSVVISAGLILLFAGGLVPRLEMPVSAVLMEVRQRLRVHSVAGKRLYSVVRRVMIAGALGLVLFFVVKVYVSGVYYVQLESRSDEAAIMARAAELNGILTRAGEDLRVEVTAPLGRNPYSAITVGPIFNEAEASDVFSRLQRALGPELRSDAKVQKVTFQKVWRRAAGFFRT